MTNPKIAPWQAAFRTIDESRYTYNATPAHTDDIHSAIIDNPDLEVITEAGGERRKANTIIASDIIRIKTQRSFFPMFSAPPKSRS